MSQLYNVIYNSSSNNLADANAVLDRIPHSILKYRQTIDLFYPHIIYKHESGLLYFSFPPECICVTSVKNNTNSKMVMNFIDSDGHVKEINVSPYMYLAPTSQVLAYINKNTHTKISFDVFLYKEKTRSKL
jgi:hypothetical protein